MRKSLSTLLRSRFLKSFLLLSFSSLILLSCGSDSNGGQSQPFELLEATIADIHDAYRSGQLTSRQLVQLYMDRIEAYDKNGPMINSIITVNPKATLGAWGGGDTHGSLFGSTRNPYDLERTVGGSSGGPGGSITAHFATVTVGQEGYASIRRPSTWNSLVGMRPTAGLVSRSGVYERA